jgi:hypothetical protein
MQRTINGIRMDIPDDATRETLLQALRRPDDSIIYAITPAGEHQVLNEGDSLASAQSERLGIVSRFRTGMRNIDRIKAEIKLLEGEYGDVLSSILEWLGDKSRQYILVGATNRPEDLPVPLSLSSEESGSPLAFLAEETEDFSGGEI